MHHTPPIQPTLQPPQHHTYNVPAVAWAVTLCRKQHTHGTSSSSVYTQPCQCRVKCLRSSIAANTHQRQHHANSLVATTACPHPSQHRHPTPLVSPPNCCPTTTTHTLVSIPLAEPALLEEAVACLMPPQLTLTAPRLLAVPAQRRLVQPTARAARRPVARSHTHHTA